MWGLGRISFTESADGVVGEIATREHLGWVGGAWTPPQVLLYVKQARHGDEPSRRYVLMTVRVTDDPGIALTRWLDLSQGSIERRFAEQALERGAARYAWTLQGVEAEQELSPELTESLRAALESTRGIDRDAWQDELDSVGRDSSHYWSLAAPAEELAPRVAAPPSASIPYFAARSGALPAPGTPTVGGVQLPAGDRCGGRVATYWGTFDEIHEPAELAARLADAFGTTGLWPLCWGWREDPVDTLYDRPRVGPEAIDALDAAEIAARWWESSDFNPAAIAPFGKPFPGLAQRSTTTSEDAAPFRVVNEKLGWQDTPGRQILLVPCNRPTDVLEVIGWRGQRLEVAEVCAMLRSWEERFAAVPIALDAWATTLAVGRPPTTMEQALHLAVEMAAVSTVETIYYDHDLRTLAAKLLWTPGMPKQPLHGDFTPTHWCLDFDHQ